MEDFPKVHVADAALAKRRKTRNWAMLVVLVGMAVLFYAIAMVKMGAILQGGTP